VEKTRLKRRRKKDADRIILKFMFNKYGYVIWTGLVFFRVGAIGGLL
jgi:hypothetical protein